MYVAMCKYYFVFLSIIFRINCTTTVWYAKTLECHEFSSVSECILLFSAFVLMPHSPHPWLVNGRAGYLQET